MKPLIRGVLLIPLFCIFYAIFDIDPSDDEFHQLAAQQTSSSELEISSNTENTSSFRRDSRDTQEVKSAHIKDEIASAESKLVVNDSFSSSEYFSDKLYEESFDERGYLEKYYYVKKSSKMTTTELEMIVSGNEFFNEYIQTKDSDVKFDETYSINGVFFSELPFIDSAVSAKYIFKEKLTKSVYVNYQVPEETDDQLFLKIANIDNPTDNEFYIVDRKYYPVETHQIYRKNGWSKGAYTVELYAFNGEFEKLLSGSFSVE